MKFRALMATFSATGVACGQTLPPRTLRMAAVALKLEADHAANVTKIALHLVNLGKRGVQIAAFTESAASDCRREAVNALTATNLTSANGGHTLETLESPMADWWREGVKRGPIAK